MSGMSGSGPLGAEAHIFWLGHPAHESAVPAAWDSGPGQCSGGKVSHCGFEWLLYRDYEEIWRGGAWCRHSPGSGATSLGATLRGASRSTWVGSSNEGAIMKMWVVIYKRGGRISIELSQEDAAC
jgi:hypothetical protein